MRNWERHRCCLESTVSKRAPPGHFPKCFHCCFHRIPTPLPIGTTPRYLSREYHHRNQCHSIESCLDRSRESRDRATDDGLVERKRTARRKLHRKVTVLLKSSDPEPKIHSGSERFQTADDRRECIANDGTVRGKAPRVIKQQENIDHV